MHEHRIQRTLTRRAFILGGLQLAGFSVLAGRLWYLQVTQRDKYQVLAEENRIQTRLLAPPRGQILDRHGQSIAGNVQNFEATVIPEQVDDLSLLLHRLSQLLPIEPAEQQRILREAKRARAFAPILIRDNLSWDEVAALELHAPELPGLSIESGEVRAYPFAEQAAHIIGYVGAVSEKEQQEAADSDDKILALPGFRIGKGGVEKQMEAQLRGIAGNEQLEVNAHGRVVRQLDRRAPVAGKPVALTVDIGLQQFVQARLAEQESAAAVVMDVNDGGIYALGSHPAFDPNLFTFGIGQADWSRLNNDERNPLSNKVLSGVYPPGSTFKTVTALAALESGMVTETHTVSCPGYMELGDHRFHCWRHQGHGTLDMVGALANSCDVYFYDVARRIGIDRIGAMGERMGLGRKLGIDMPNERAGALPRPSFLRSKKDAPWQMGETLIAAIGQGSVLATPLQLATLAARIANGGKAVIPHIIRGGDDQPDIRDIGLPKKHLDIVRRGMIDVVNKPGATAYGSRITDPAMAMAGKTGSAQVRRIGMAERAKGVIPNEARPWKERDHALFIAYAPIDNPRFAISVIVEHGGGGAKVAAPIARDILIEAQKLT